MERPERSTFTTLDFLTWRETDALVLTPKFQRRVVWTTPARSYFIDSLLREIPVPPILLRISQSEDKKRTVREIVDGQQRLRALLDFVDNKYSLSRSAVEQWGGKRFEDLEEDEKTRIRNYSFTCEVFRAISDAEVLEVFARVNMYSVRLNAQELRNGKYFGYFKRTAYSLAREHLEFWRHYRIFTENNIARMLEVEFTSELMVAAMGGLQDKKKSLDRFYAEYNENFPQREQVVDRFRSVIDAVTETIGDDLGYIEFHRPPLFYTLYCAIYHYFFGLPRFEAPTQRRTRFSTDAKNSLRDALSTLSERISAAREGREIPSTDFPFVNACVRQTDNLKPREIRLQKLYKEGLEAYSIS